MYRPAVANGADAGSAASPVVIAVPSTRAACDTGSRRRASVQRARLSQVRILELAIEGDTLFRGWSATQLLMGLPHFLTVCVAPAPEARAAGAQDGHDLQARVSKADPMEPTIGGNGGRFDLELTMGRLSVEGAAQVVIDACSSAAQNATAASLRLLQDRLEEARLCATVAALRQDEDLAGWRGAVERRRSPRLRRSAAGSQPLQQCPTTEIETGSLLPPTAPPPREETTWPVVATPLPALCMNGEALGDPLPASAAGHGDAIPFVRRSVAGGHASALGTAPAVVLGRGPGRELHRPWQQEDLLAEQ